MSTSFFFEKPNKTRSFYRSSFQSNLIKHAGEILLFCVMPTFKVQKCLGTLLRNSFAHKRSIYRTSNASWMISYSDVLQGIAVFLRFITDLRCWERKRRFGTIVNNQFNQARRQDLAAGGPKTRRGGHIFKIQYWMYAATGGPNVKWGCTDFNWRGWHHWPPPLATALSLT